MIVVTHDDVRAIALGLPGAVERPSYGGQPSWRTKNRMSTWSLTTRRRWWRGSSPRNDKEASLASGGRRLLQHPPLNDGYLIVLARLDVVDVEEAVEFITDSWRLRRAEVRCPAWDAEHD